MKLRRALIAARAVSSRLCCTVQRQNKERCDRQSMCGKVPQQNAVHARSPSTQASRLRRVGVASTNCQRFTAGVELIQRVGNNGTKDCWAELLSWHSSDSNRDNKPRVRHDLGHVKGAHAAAVSCAATRWWTRKGSSV
jgi:hypothetical protein